MTKMDEYAVSRELSRTRLRSRIDLFSTDAFIDMLARWGRAVGRQVAPDLEV
jgi:hypothetical protein